MKLNQNYKLDTEADKAGIKDQYPYIDDKNGARYDSERRNNLRK